MGQIWENKALCGPNYYIQSVGIIIYSQLDTVSGGNRKPFTGRIRLTVYEISQGWGCPPLAYLILHVITIKCISCMQEKTEFSCKLQRSTLISTKILGDLFLATEIKQHKTRIKNCKKFSGVAKSWHPAAQGMQLPLHATP